MSIERRNIRWNGWGWAAQNDTVAAREDPTHFRLDGRYFQAIDEEGVAVQPERGLAKPARAHVLTALESDGRAISFFGDLHPSFFGNVVKAMASATRPSCRRNRNGLKPGKKNRKGLEALWNAT